MKSLHGFAQIALHWTEDNKRRITCLIKQSDSPCLLQSTCCVWLNSRIPLVCSSCACSRDNVSVWVIWCSVRSRSTKFIKKNSKNTWLAKIVTKREFTWHWYKLLLKTWLKTCVVLRNYWYRPVCQNYKSESGCKFGEKVRLYAQRGWQSAQRKPKKTGGKGSVALLKNSNQFWLCISGCRAAEIQIDSTEVSTIHSSHCCTSAQFLSSLFPDSSYAHGHLHNAFALAQVCPEKGSCRRLPWDRLVFVYPSTGRAHTILGTEAQRALLEWYLTPRKNSGKRGSIARCYSAFCTSWTHERSPYAPKFEDRYQEKNLATRTMRPTEKPVTRSSRNQKLKWKWGHRTGTGRLVARVARMGRGVRRKSRRWRSVSITERTRKHFSRFRFGTS